MYCTLDGPVNALSLNKDATKVVVAGRNVLKIYNIEEDKFREECNLKVGKIATLNFSSLDVAWSPLEDNLIASAATNGAVVLWNLNKLAKNKADNTYTVHKRTVNKVSFHPTESSCMLSGSQDATIKLFDLRKKEVSLTFDNGTDSIRDLQFSWHSPSIFAAADEAGNIKFWDTRNSDRPLKQFTAHGGPVLSLDFHPTTKALIATGGRDKVIKVWDWQQPDKPPSVAYSVQTTAPVSKIKWRLNQEWHIASCSMVIDYCIHVWDIRRPYIPFATFDDHTDVATGLAWRQEEVFLSCGKDGLLVQHLFQNAMMPAEMATPVTVDVGPQGDIAFAFGTHLLKLISAAQRNDSNQLLKFGGLASFGKSRQNTGNNQSQKSADLFHKPLKSKFTVNMLNSSDKIYSSDWFRISAKQYKLCDRPFSELCDHNARIAENLERPHIVQIWLIFKELLDIPLCNRGDPLSLTNSNADTSDYNESRAASTTADGQLVEQAGPDTTGAITETETEEDGFDVTDGKRRQSFSIKQRTYAGIGVDMFFGDGELARIVFDEFEILKGIEKGSEWKLQQEAFEPRPELNSINDLTDGYDSGIHNQAAGSPSAVQDTDVSSISRSVTLQARSFVNLTSHSTKVVSFDCYASLREVLTQLVEEGDIQMAVSLLILLGDKARHLIDEYTQLCCLTVDQSVVDLLDRFMLWTTSAIVIKLCPLPEINCLSQQSTSVSLGCNFCEKPLPKKGWWCQKCKRTTYSCSVCQQVVKGLFVCCHGCWHGGHLVHMKNWFAKNSLCPAGCGHRCEYV